jgi:hypothetical protein
MVDKRGVYAVLVGKTERYHLANLGVDGRIILKWILKERDGARPGLFWLRTGTGDGLL